MVRSRCAHVWWVVRLTDECYVYHMSDTHARPLLVICCFKLSFGQLQRLFDQLSVCLSVSSHIKLVEKNIEWKNTSEPIKKSLWNAFLPRFTFVFFRLLVTHVTFYYNLFCQMSLSFKKKKNVKFKYVCNLRTCSFFVPPRRLLFFGHYNHR